MLQTSRHSLKLVAIYLFLFLLNSLSYASPQFCKPFFSSKEVWTARQAISSAQLTIENNKSIEPKVNHTLFGSNGNVERMGVEGPKAFDYFLPQGTRYLATPDPNTEHPVISTRLISYNSGSLRVHLPWKDSYGKMVTSTTDLFFNIPWAPEVTEFGRPLPKSPYLIGPEFEVVNIHLHGGGTPSAVAMNASSKGEFFAKRGIPNLAITLPGHGHSTDIAMGSTEEILRWVRAIMEQYVDPRVKFTLSGHSWGGQFTVIAQRLFKDDRFVGFFAESPVVDITLGGEWRKRFEKNEEFWRKVIEVTQGLAPDTEHLLERISPEDLKFLENIEKNGKLSPRASFMAMMTGLDFSTPLLLKADREQLKPLVTYMGAYDGLVFVGRERAALKYFMRSGELVLLKEGDTFRGKIKVGHQIFDVTRLDKNGKPIHFVFNDQVERLRAMDFTKDKPIHQSKLMDMLHSAWLKYQNNFAFRSYFDFVRTHLKWNTKASDKLSIEFSELENSLLKFEKMKEELAIKQKVAQSEEIAKYAKDHGLIVRKDFGVSGDLEAGIKSAQAELKVTRSPDRKRDLEKFVQEVRNLRNEFEKPSGKIEDSKLRAIKLRFELEYEQSLSGIKAEIEDRYGKKINDAESVYNVAFKFFRSEEILAKLSRKNADLHSDNDLEKEIKSLGFENVEQIKVFVKNLGEKLANKKNAKEGERETLVAIEFGIQKFKENSKVRSKSAGGKLDELISQIKRPEGVTNSEVARWELLIQNYDEQTEAQRYGKSETSLYHYLNNIEQFYRESNLRWEFHIKQSVRDFKWPHGFKSSEQVQDRIKYLNAIINDKWMPDNVTPKLRKTFNQMRQLEEQVSEVETIKAQLQKEIIQLRREREKKLRFVKEQIPTEESEKEQANIQYDSPEVAEYKKEFYQKLMEYKEANIRYSEAQEKYLANAYEQSLKLQNKELRDSFMKKAIQESEIRFSKLAKFYLDKENAFLKARENHRRTRLNAAIKGLSRTEKDPDGSRLREALIALYGRDDVFENGQMSSDSIEYRLEKQKDEMELLNQKHLKLLSKLEVVRAQYYQSLPKENRIYQAHTYKWSALFNKPFPDLWDWFNDPNYGPARQEAFSNMMRDWDSLWKDAVLEDQNWASFDWINVQRGIGGQPEVIVP